MEGVPTAAPRPPRTGARRAFLDSKEFRAMMAVLRAMHQGKDALEVETVDLKKRKNKFMHQTDVYEIDLLVLRRGEAFDLSITFNRNIEADDTVILQVSTGPRPQESKGSLHRLHLQSKTKPEKRFRTWKVESVKIDGRTMSVSVTPHPGAIIGYHEIFVETKIAKDEELNRFSLQEKIIVIFNANCKEDQVYMENEEERFEYVMNPSGEIWGPGSSSRRGKKWNFGQFEAPCLEAALYLLYKTDLGDLARASPISTLRCISALVNNWDDNGVVAGNWSGNYPEGTTPPTTWAGSVAILQEYMKTKEPVCYGQCWVFSAVSTTLCRALGIPTRSVTNYDSAHDTDGSLTIDYHYDTEREPIRRLNDSIWNYHVWNESWLKRPDLPPGYDGWQAHDATPQERSGDVHRCGPASVKAIKEGHVWLSYDVGFIFGEVNGDIIRWEVHGDGTMTPYSINHSKVGKYISTKAVGTSARDDVTDHYKYQDGSDKGREVVKSVASFGARGHFDVYDDIEGGDVEFRIAMPYFSTMVHEDFEVGVKLWNISEEPRTVHGDIIVFTASYTGVTVKQIAQMEATETVGPSEEKKITLKVKSEDFQRNMTADAIVMAEAYFKVLETGRKWGSNMSRPLARPMLEFTVPKEIKLGKTVKGVVKFTNELSLPLTDVEIRMEGGKAIKDTVYKHGKTLAPKAVLTYEFDVTPKKTGQRTIEATLSSNEMSGVDGSARFTVLE